MSKEIEIGGCIEVPDEITMDEFCKGRWYYMQCLEINSIKVYFDKKKTQKNITNYNEPCDCQDCRNYYKNIESNVEVREFLSQFGIDYLRTEEIISYELRLKDKNSPIHSMAYYDVFGYIEKEFSVKKGGYTILFKKNADVNVGHEGVDEYFWIVLDMVIPYVLEEERELSYVSDETSIFTKFRELMSKIFKPKKSGKEILENQTGKQ